MADSSFVFYLMDQTDLTFKRSCLFCLMLPQQDLGKFVSNNAAETFSNVKPIFESF